MNSHAINGGLINKFTDSVYGELKKGDILRVSPPAVSTAMPEYEFELVGFNPTRPEIARAKVTIDGKPVDGTQRIDFERFGDPMHDRTEYLTGDWRYGARPVYLNRLGSDYTEVV